MSIARYAGEASSDQRPANRSNQERCSGLNAAALEMRHQYLLSASRAPAASPFIHPSASTAAFIAPADVPEIPAIRSQGSSRSRPKTPPVNAPWEPPP